VTVCDHKVLIGTRSLIDELQNIFSKYPGRIRTIIWIDWWPVIPDGRLHYQIERRVAPC
jgi:hypothetical protein